MHVELSVLIPVYNAEHFISETLESLINQTFRNFELLVCDDGSVDNSWQILKKYAELDSRIRVFRNEKNVGKPLTIKRLFEISRGEIITMHDADDLSVQSRFEKMLVYMRANPQFAMCGHNIQRITEDGRLLDLYRTKTDVFKDIIAGMKKDNTDGDASMFIRRDIVESIGGLFRPYFQNNMDYDLALRITERFPTSNLLEVLLYYRNVSSSISKNITSYKKLITQNVTMWLAEERRMRGTDSLFDGNYIEIEKMEQYFSRPYLDDKTLYLHELASKLMYFQMRKNAVNCAWAAVRMEPSKVRNWRLLQYCIRKSISSFLA